MKLMSQAYFERKNIPKDQRMNSIFHMCLVPDGFSDHLSLTSPKNFAVQYFTVSQNHPVKICRRSQCPFTAHGLRTQEKRQQPACSELSRCKHSQIAIQDQFSHCANLPKEIQKTSVELTPCTASLKKRDDDSSWDHDISPTSSKQGYNSTFNSRSCCASKLSTVESLRVKKNHTLQQTDPEQSWQARCSSFIMNLPVTLSDKLFGPRTTCEAWKDGKRTINKEDSGIKSQPVSENSSIPSSRDQGNKKSVKSRPSSLGDRGCHKNIGTDRVFLEKENQVEPCYLTTTQSLQEGIRCRISSGKSEKSTTTCEKPTSKCGQSCDDSFSQVKRCANHSDGAGVRSRGSEPHEPRLKGSTRNQTRSSISEGKKTPYRFSNWPAVLTEKIFGPRNEKVLQCCDVDDEVRHAKVTDVVADSPEIVSKIGKPSVAKNGRLLLKKYTILQTSEAMEETLCFDILSGKQLNGTRTKLQSSNNKRRLETIQEQNEVLGKCFRTYRSKRCMKSRGNSSELCSRRTKQVEEKTSTEHNICLTSLIMKLLNRNREDKYAALEEECHRSTASGQNRDMGNRRGRKCAFKQRAKTVLRKYATTSMHKHRHKSIKCPRYVGKYSRNEEAVSCSLKQNVLSQTCRTIIDLRDNPGEDQSQKQIPSHFVSRRKEVLEQDSSRNVGNYRKNNSIPICTEKRSRKRCHHAQFPKSRVCKRLIIVNENELPIPTKRQMFVIADDDICVRTFTDRETCTDDFLCEVRVNDEERIPNQESMCTRTILDGDKKNAKNCSSSSQRTEQSGITHVIRNSDGQDSVGFNPQSRSPEEGPLLDRNSNGSMQKLAENAMRIRVGHEECVESFCRDDACSVRPRGISEGEDIPDAEQDVEKVFSSLWQEVWGESGNTVCGDETCLYKTLIKSETKDAPGILKEDEFCQMQNMLFKVNDISPSLVTAKASSPEDTGNSTNKSSNQQYEGINDDEQLLKTSPRKSKELDDINLRMNFSEKQSGWIKSPGKYLVVTRAESRNIINSYYSQKKRVLASGRELARNNERANMKKGKVQRDGSASEKSITKTRTPFQQIENSRQVVCNANVVIEDDKSKKRDAVEKENKTVDKKTQYTQGGKIFNDDSKNYLVQNIAIDNLSLTNDSIGVPTADDVHSIHESIETYSAVILETQPPPTKIGEKSRLLKENKTSEQVSASNTKAPENSNANLKENSRKAWSRLGNSTIASKKTGAKGRAKEGAKIAESAKSESADRLTRPIDTYDRKRREKEASAYIFDKENIKPRSLRIEMSTVEEQNIPNAAIGKGAGRNAKGLGSRESSKSSILQRNGERRQNDRSRNSSAKKEIKENKQTKKKQSKSITGSKKNEKDKTSAPLKLLSQIDSKTDASTSTQGLVTMNADLFTSALMDGKNNIESYRDLQSAGEENSNSDRIPTSKDEGLRKSATAMARSKSKVLKSYKSSKTNARKTPEKSKSDEKSRNLKEYVDEATQTSNVADEANTDNILSRTPPAIVHMENSNEELTENSGHNKGDVTAGDSLNIEISNVEPCRSTTCKNNANCQRDFKQGLSVRNPRQVEHLESAAFPKKNTSKESFAGTSNKAPNHKILACKSRMSSCHTKNEAQTLFSKRSLDANKKTKQEARGNILPSGSPPCRSCRDRNVSKLNHAGERIKNMANMQKKGIHSNASARREEAEKRAKELITEIENSLMSKVKCKKSMDSESNSDESKRLCEDLKNSSNEEDKQIEQHNNVADELTTLCTSGRTISGSSNRNFCFTDDVKRFLDQGQEFSGPKIRKNSNQTTLCSDVKQEPRPCGGFKSNESEARCTKASKFCESVD